MFEFLLFKYIVTSFDNPFLIELHLTRDLQMRPKRNISKPLRYQTTSSDESPKRRNTASITGDIDKDIEDLRRIGQNMDNEINYFFSP